VTETSVRQVQVTIDCAKPRALSEFWNEVLGYQLPPPPPGFDSWDAFSESLPPEQRDSASASVDPDGAGPRLFFQRVPEGKTAKNRVHLDVRAAPGLDPDARRARLTEESERLIELGATKLYEFQESGQFWITMQDPEGNEFCLD